MEFVVMRNCKWKICFLHQLKESRSNPWTHLHLSLLDIVACEHCELCVASRSDTLWHSPSPIHTHIHKHTLTLTYAHKTHHPPVSYTLTHTQVHHAPHPPTRQWFYVPCRHPVLSHFLLVCHTVSFSSSIVLPLSSSPLPLYFPIPSSDQ